jgi:nitroimidazol reductase NimA-like FMN-containing flavoprotein (pyridoxamine 5'-phosphate oxidase superfamily)
MQPMTDAERRGSSPPGRRPPALATTRADGSPHVAPIWFLPDGDDVVFTTWHASVKGRNLARDPRAAISVDDRTSRSLSSCSRGPAR